MAPATESIIPIPVVTPNPIILSLNDIEGHMLEFSPPAISVIGVVSPDESFRFSTLRNLSILWSFQIFNLYVFWKSLERIGDKVSLADL